MIKENDTKPSPENEELIGGIYKNFGAQITYLPKIKVEVGAPTIIFQNRGDHYLVSIAEVDVSQTFEIRNVGFSQLAAMLTYLRGRVDFVFIDQTGFADRLGI